MNRPEATEPQPTEDRQTEGGSMGAQRLMFTGYWEWNLKTREYHWCEEMYRIFNLTPQQFTLRTGTFFNGIHPEDRGKVAKALGKALVGKQPYDLKHRIVRPDGSVRSVHGKAEVTFDGQGRPRRVWGTVQDLTDGRQVGEL
jgi:PAS domain S-box-containing protein